MRISQKTADALPPSSGDTWHWDDTLKGFAVRVRSNGSKSYWVRYTLPDGTKRKKNLGPVSTTKAEAARDRARDYLEAARHGRDIVKADRERRHSPPVRELAERHQKEHSPPLISKSTWSNNETLWRVHILPAIGTKPVLKIDRQDVKTLLKPYADRPSTWNAIRNCLSKALTDCEDWGWRDVNSNPVRGIKKLRVKGREVILEPDELSTLLGVLAAMKRERPVAIGTGWAAPYLFEILLLTGRRAREWAHAEWAWVDEKRGLLTVPRTKTDRNAIFEISDQALGVLQSMPRPTKWVFPNMSHTGPYTWYADAWQKIRTRAGIPNVRLHDLRHTFATYAHTMAGVSMQELATILGHSDIRMTQRYVNIAERLKREAARRGSSAIMAAAEEGRGPGRG